MNIGIAYDLRREYLAQGFSEEETAEFDHPDTIDAIDSALCALGHTTVRIGHIRSLVARLAQGETWDLVFNISEGMYGFSREAQVPALLEAYNIPCTFSDALTLSVALHKGIAKQVVRAHGVPTADFMVLQSEADISALKLPYPLFVKPVAEGTGKGVTPLSKVHESGQCANRIQELLAQYHQPVLVETFLSGREFTVGITGTGTAARVIGTLEIILLPQAEAEVYSYINKEECEQRVEYRLVNDALSQAAATTALAGYRALGCRDAGRVDIRCDSAGIPHFIEVNPVAGMHPEHSDLPILCTKVGITYQELIQRIVESASERVKKNCV